MRASRNGKIISHSYTEVAKSSRMQELHGKLVKLKFSSSPFPTKVKDEAVTTWVKPSLVAEVKFTEWTSSGEMRHPVYLGLRTDKRAEDVVREREKSHG